MPEAVSLTSCLTNFVYNVPIIILLCFFELYSEEQHIIKNQTMSPTCVSPINNS